MAAPTVTFHTDRDYQHEVEQQPRVIKRIDFSKEANKIIAAGGLSILNAPANCVVHGFGQITHTPEGSAVTAAIQFNGGDADIAPTNHSMNSAEHSHIYYSIGGTTRVGGKYIPESITVDLIPSAAMSIGEHTFYLKYTRLGKTDRGVVGT